MRSLSTNPGPLHVIILSAERSNLSEDGNFRRTNDLQSRLESMRLLGDIAGFARAVGVWRGHQEESFVVLYDPIRHPMAASHLVQLARAYQQDSILMADASRDAMILPICDPDCGGAIGKLRQLYPGEPLPDGYTILKGVVYICK